MPPDMEIWSDPLQNLLFGKMGSLTIFTEEYDLFSQAKQPTE